LNVNSITIKGVKYEIRSVEGLSCKKKEMTNRLIITADLKSRLPPDKKSCLCQPFSFREEDEDAK